MRLAAESVADDGQTVKWLWALADGSRVETVLMHYPDRATVCVSSQAGCAMGCSFCATGQAGFARHLSTGEIVEQVIVARRSAHPSRLSNVVFMGMGEPLANYDRVWSAIERLHVDVGLSARHLTISTVGVVPGIRRLARESLPVNLAVSLHAANDPLRDTLVPLNRRYPLRGPHGGLSPVPDGQRPAAQLRVGPHRRESTTAPPTPPNCPPWPDPSVPTSTSSLSTPPRDTSRRGTPPAGVRQFRDQLLALGVNVTVRRNRGTDIDAACGQLAARPAAMTTATASLLPN